MAKEVPFSEWLSEQLQQSGLTQAQIARLADVNQTTIYKLLNGKTKRPDPETCQVLAKVLKMDLRTVYRAAGYWSVEPEYPEQDDLNHIAAQLPELKRQELLAIARVMLEFEQKK